MITTTTTNTPLKNAVALKKPLTATSNLLDLIVITWAVPTERVAALIPSGLSLDRLPNAEGDLVAFVQFACALHAGRRWSPLPASTGDAFHRADFRVLVRPTATPVKSDNITNTNRKTPATFLLQTHLSTEEARISMRAVAKEARFGRFNLHIAGNPALAECLRYELTLQDDDSQITTIVAEAMDSNDDTVPAPFASGEDMAKFLLARDETYYAGSLGGVGKVPFERTEYQPKPLKLLSAKIPFFIKQNILTESELSQPLCMFYQPGLVVNVYPPRSAVLD